jgi:hypothetical protein
VNASAFFTTALIEGTLKGHCSNGANSLLMCFSP